MTSHHIAASISNIQKCTQQMAGYHTETGTPALHELYVGTCATEYAEHFWARWLHGPAVACFLLTWKGNSMKEILHFAVQRFSRMLLSILHPIPSPKCGDFGTTTGEMPTCKAEWSGAQMPPWELLLWPWESGMDDFLFTLQRFYTLLPTSFMSGTSSLL